MKKPGYYSSGEFARMAHVTLRTIRYYDKHDILKPTWVSESGARFYTDEDFARLQQILLLLPGRYPRNDHRRFQLPFYAEFSESAAQAGPGPHRTDAARRKSNPEYSPGHSDRSYGGLEPDAGSDPSDRNGKKSEKSISERFQYFRQN